MTTTYNTNRIEYIDALRGFAILMVILGHVFLFCFDGNQSIICEWVKTFRMPLFFFISGFVMYKSTSKWEYSGLPKYLWRKSIQVLPPIIFFFLIHEIINGGGNIRNHFIHSSKGGYWFTLAWMYYYIIYTNVRCVLNSSKVRGKIEDIIVLLLGLLLYFGIPFLTKRGLWIFYEEYDPMSLTKLNLYFFFCMGTLCRKYYQEIKCCLDKGLLTFLFLIISILGFMARVQYGFNIPIIFISIAGIFLCLYWFCQHESYFSQETTLGCYFQFVGKRTLDIYLIHYFVLPTQLSCIGEWFSENNMPFLYFFCGICISVFVLLFSLIISSIIRLSPFAARWLLGVK